MKLRNLMTGAALALMIAATAIAQEKPGNGTNGSPKLAIASMSHDFGEVKPGTPLKYSFTFKNQGKADLLIHSVTPG